jgi:multiple sugar transport system permease protein
MAETTQQAPPAGAPVRAEAARLRPVRREAGPGFYVILAVLVVMALGPIMLMVTTSLQSQIDIVSGAPGLLFAPTLDNYETVLCDILWYEPEHLRFCDPTFSRALGNSLLIATVSTALTLLMGTMAAYAIVRFRFIGRDAVGLGTLLMRMVPPAVLLVPIFGIWTFQYGLDRTYTGVILVYVAMNLPFVIWILQSFIQQVPVPLEEAARMDGANPFQVFFLVVLPLIKPGLAAAAIFTFRIAWNEFILANVLLGRETRTVPVTIVNSLTEHNIDWGVIMATGMLLAIPPVIFTLLASRQIITGMTAGAVKG